MEGGDSTEGARGSRARGWPGGRVGAGLGEGRHLLGPPARRGRAGQPGGWARGLTGLFLLLILVPGAGPPRSSSTPHEKLPESNSSARSGGAGCVRPYLEGGAHFISLVIFSLPIFLVSVPYGLGGLHLPYYTAGLFTDCVSASSSSHLGGLSSLSASCHLSLHPPGSWTLRRGRSFLVTPHIPMKKGRVGKRCAGPAAWSQTSECPPNFPGVCFRGL